MPGVGKKKFSYTKKGKAKAKMYAKKVGKKVRKTKSAKKTPYSEKSVSQHETENSQIDEQVPKKNFKEF